MTLLSPATMLQVATAFFHSWLWAAMQQSSLAAALWRGLQPRHQTLPVVLAAAALPAHHWLSAAAARAACNYLHACRTLCRLSHTPRWACAAFVCSGTSVYRVVYSYSHTYTRFLTWRQHVTDCVQFSFTFFYIIFAVLVKYQESRRYEIIC